MTIDVSRFTFRLPKALFDKLKCEAQQQGVSVNALILQILWDWAKKNDNDKKAR